MDKEELLLPNHFMTCLNDYCVVIVFDPKKNYRTNPEACPHCGEAGERIGK